MNRKFRAALIAALILIITVIVILIITRREDDFESVSFNFSKDRDEYSDDVRIAEGIVIGDIYVGGLRKEEARDRLSEAYSMPENTSVNISWLDDAFSTSLNEMGVSWGINRAVNSAITLAKGGGLLQRYKTKASLADIPYHIDLSKGLDKEAVTQYVKSMANERDIMPENAMIRKLASGGFEITPGSNGYITNITKTVGLIMSGFNEIDPGEQLDIAACVEIVEPKIKSRDLETIETSLGAFTTQYRKPDRERTDRCTNVEVGTANISGTLLLPGETASTSELLKERNAENGYVTGGQYVNGQLEDAIGGGVCQVASTLYNALLHAEIQIDKRSNHSLLVTYVDPSYDAAIANGSKDLVFTNNLSTPIYIYGETDGYNVTFRIYGREYRDSSHRVEYVNVVDKRIISEDIIKEDWDMYTDEHRTVGVTHDECYSHLDKLVYENDKLVSRTTLHKDYYMPSRATVYKGMKVRPEQTDTAAADDSPAADNQDDNREAD